MVTYHDLGSAQSVTLSDGSTYTVDKVNMIFNLTILWVTDSCQIDMRMIVDNKTLELVELGTDEPLRIVSIIKNSID